MFDLHLLLGSAAISELQFGAVENFRSPTSTSASLFELHRLELVHESGEFCGHS